MANPGERGIAVVGFSVQVRNDENVSALGSAADQGLASDDPVAPVLACTRL